MYSQTANKSLLKQVSIFVGLCERGVLQCWQHRNSIVIAYGDEVLDSLDLDFWPDFKDELEHRRVAISVG